MRSLSLTDATMLVVSSTIGSGIFLTPGAVADLLPHPGLILAAWLVGGALSLAGALANAELGAMYPHAGGDYVYLREAYHPAAGFLVGWLTFFVIYAGSIATLALGFAEGLASFVALGAAGKMAVAIALTLATTWINYLGVRPGAHLNNITGILKVVALVALVVAAPLFGHGSTEHLQPLVAGAGIGVDAPPSVWRSRRCCSPISDGTRRSTSRARSTPPSATCRARCCSASASARRSTWP